MKVIKVFEGFEKPNAFKLETKKITFCLLVNYTKMNILNGYLCNISSITLQDYKNCVNRLLYLYTHVSDVMGVIVLASSVSVCLCVCPSVHLSHSPG